MQTLSATAAISPAWHYTRQLLWEPRRWQLLLKIGAVAFFAQMGSGFNFNFGSPGQMKALPGNVTTILLPLLLVIGLVGLLIALVMFYVGSRLQFVLFEVVLRRDTTVAPIWSRYGAATWPWIGLKLLFILATILSILGVLLCMSPVLIPFGIHMFHAYQSAGELSPSEIVSIVLIAGCAIFILLAVVIVLGAAFTLISDFGLPSMALEATPIRETVRRVWQMFRAEKGQVLLYILMRFALGFAGALVLEFGLFLLALVALIPLGGLGLVLWFSLHTGGLPAQILMVGGWVVLGIVLLAILILAAIVGFGYLFTFIQAYALFFLGGRYPRVGQYLEWFLPPAPVYPPPAPGA